MFLCVCQVCTVSLAYIFFFSLSVRMYVCVCTVLKPKIPRYYSPTFWPRVARFLLSSVAGNGIIIILLCTVQTQEKRELNEVAPEDEGKIISLDKDDVYKSIPLK